MAFDKFTIHQYRALKECPAGQQPGEVFEVTEDVGDILIAAGAAERVEDEPKPVGRYKRRDLRAEP